MHIEVDQSGKIEDYLDTVVAFRNKEQYTVLLKRKLKNEILTNYRKKYKDIYYRLFAILIYYCIKNYLEKVQLIIIDEEYEKRGIDIKKHLLRFIWKQNPKFDIMKIIDFQDTENLRFSREKLIRFSRIGKKSRAHRLAYQTFTGKLAPNKIITEKEVEELI